MVLFGMLCKHVFRLSHVHQPNVVTSACISVSSIRSLDQRWRKQNNRPENPNKERILLDLPDYSFTDNRPVPYGSRQKRRIEKQMEYTAKIIKLTEEVDFAMKRHEEMLKEKEDNVKAILDRKLKPKGNALLKKKS